MEPLSHTYIFPFYIAPFLFFMLFSRWMKMNRVEANNPVAQWCRFSSFLGRVPLETQPTKEKVPFFPHGNPLGI